MAIDLDVIFTEKVQEFRANADSERFTSNFLTAARNTVRKMEIHNGHEVSLSTITSTATQIETIAEEYTFVVSAGITFFLMRLGQKPIDGRAVDTAKTEWLDAEGDYLMGLITTDMQNADNDIVGLGAIGRNGLD